MQMKIQYEQVIHQIKESIDDMKKSHLQIQSTLKN